MSVIAVIPSRYGSSRFDGKPLAEIAGVSMIERVYSLAKQALRISDVIVATDDHRILEKVESFGGKAVMTSDTNRSGTDRVAETAEMMGLSPDDILINIQGDQPLFDPACLDQLVEPFFSDPELEMSTLAFEIVNKREITDPKDVKVVFDRDGFALYFSRSPIPVGRDASTVFPTYKHLGFYAYTKKFLDTFKTLPQGVLEDIEKLEQLRVLEFGHRIKVVVTPFDSPEVDLPIDIDRIEQIIKG